MTDREYLIYEWLLVLLILPTLFDGTAADLSSHKTQINRPWKQKPLSDHWRVDDDDQVPDISPQYDIFESDHLPGNMHYMASVGNGHIAANMLGDTIYMNGLYSGDMGWSHRARIPYVHSSNVTVSGHDITSHRYRLDTTRAVFEHKLNSTDQSDPDNTATVTYRVYAHHFYSRLLVTEFIIERTGTSDGEITINTGDLVHDEDESNDLILNVTREYINEESGCGGSVPVIRCYSRQGCIRIPETDISGNTNIQFIYRRIPDTHTLAAGDDINTWTYIMAIDKNLDVAETDFNAGMAYLKSGDSTGLLKNHTNAWQEVWSNGNIDMSGDSNIDTVRKVIRGSLYYLYSNLPSHHTNSPSDQFYGLSPGGLANGAFGNDYYGHVFWDMDIWMYPGILLMRPDLAKEMLSYRIYGSDPAFDRAASGGYNGTRFPWESGFTGVEVTPDICPACRDNQQHITGDIAFAARQYVSATRDVDWLTTTHSDTPYTGFDFIQNMAKFWFTRPTYSPEKDKYEINGVMPPDEHQVFINNSIYTNVVASLSVHFARYASCLAGRSPEQDVPTEWIERVQNLYFPFNTERRYHEEYEGYEWDVQNNITDFEHVKQADVVLMGYPLLWKMPDDVRQNDLLEYEGVTSPGGPAMTWGVFATGWLDMGDDDKAATLFNRSYQLYYREPFKIWTEAQQGAGAINFITGMGGFLQALVSGYGGLRLNVENLSFRRPKLPPGAQSLNVTGLKYLGAELNLNIAVSEVTVTTTKEGQTPLRMYLADGAEHDLTTGSEYTFPSQDFLINTTTATGCPLPLDNIDVVYDLIGTTTPSEIDAGTRLSGSTLFMLLANVITVIIHLS